MTPSVMSALKAKRRAEEYRIEEQGRASKQMSEEVDVRAKVAEQKKAKAQATKQGEGDRAGVKVGCASLAQVLFETHLLASRINHQPPLDPPDAAR